MVTVLFHLPGVPHSPRGTPTATKGRRNKPFSAPSHLVRPERYGHEAMKPEQIAALRDRALHEPEGVLHVWLRDPRRTVKNIAQQELLRRDREMAQRQSLTGVLTPLDAA